MTARTLFESGALSALVAMTRGALWQCPIDPDRLYPFHALRHTAITNVYRKSRGLVLAQRFPRHASPLTTVVYTHATDDDLREGVRGLRC